MSDELNEALGAGDNGEQTAAPDPAAVLAAAQAKLESDTAALAVDQEALASAQAAHDQAAAQLAADQQAVAQAQADVQAQAAEVQAKADALAAEQQAVPETVAAVAAAVAPVTTDVETAHSILDDIEATAIKWGGDIGTDLRNLAGKLRTLFAERPAAEAAPDNSSIPAAVQADTPAA